MMTPANIKSVQMQRRWLQWAFYLFAAVCGVGFCSYLITPAPRPFVPAAAAPAAEPAPPPAPVILQTVKTARGTFTVPGPARLDGAGEVRDINIWNAAERTRMVCVRVDQTPIELIESVTKAAEQRVYFRIRAQGCEGWIPESFVAQQ